MKIDAVDLTLFAWDDIPPTTLHGGLAEHGGPQQSWPAACRDRRRHRRLRLSRLRNQPGRDRCRRADPLPETDPDGQGPARARGAACCDADAPAQHGAAHGRCLRHGAVGHRRQGGRHAALLVPRRRAVGDRRLCLEPGAGEPAGLCRGGREVQGRRLEGLQDPSARDPPTRTSRSARPCARRSATTIR